jgi:hypothetical protein
VNDRKGDKIAMTDDYPIRYVAFVDILGFRSLITQLDRDPSLLKSVRQLLTTAHDPPSGLENFFKDADFKSSTISDAVALSSKVTPSRLQYLFNTIEHLARDLLALGYFIRGAIVKDRLFHDEKMVLGAGLVRAFSRKHNR